MARSNDHLPDLVEKQRVVQVVSYEDEWIEALNVTLDDSPTAFWSTPINIAGATGCGVKTSILSVGAPTTVRVVAYFSHDCTATTDATATWVPFEEGLWASLFWEDTDTATEKWGSFTLPCSGDDWLRFYTVGVGTGEQATFTVKVYARPFRGAYASAHS